MFVCLLSSLFWQSLVYSKTCFDLVYPMFSFKTVNTSDLGFVHLLQYPFLLAFCFVVTRAGEGIGWPENEQVKDSW